MHGGEFHGLNYIGARPQADGMRQAQQAYTAQQAHYSSAPALTRRTMDVHARRNRLERRLANWVLAVAVLALGVLLAAPALERAKSGLAARNTLVGAMGSAGAGGQR